MNHNNVLPKNRSANTSLVQAKEESNHAFDTMNNYTTWGLESVSSSLIDQYLINIPMQQNISISFYLGEVYV